MNKKLVTICVSDDTFNHLRRTSIHNKENVETVIENLIKQHYESRKKD